MMFSDVHVRKNSHNSGTERETVTILNSRLLTEMVTPILGAHLETMFKGLLYFWVEKSLLHI